MSENQNNEVAYSNDTAAGTYIANLIDLAVAKTSLSDTTEIIFTVESIREIEEPFVITCTFSRMMVTVHFEEDEQYLACRPEPNLKYLKTVAAINAMIPPPTPLHCRGSTRYFITEQMYVDFAEKIHAINAPQPIWRR